MTEKSPAFTQLKKLYETSGFPSKPKLESLAKQKKINYTTNDLETIYKQSYVKELHAKPKKVIEHPIVTPNKHIELQMDLLYMGNFYKQNKNHGWILIVIDIYTRVAWAVPLKNKSTEEVARGLKEIMNKMGFVPKMIDSDNGSEWKAEVSQLMKDKGVVHNTNDVGDHNVLGIVDSFSRTLKNMIYKSMTFTNDTTWLDKLDGFMDAYNDMVHSNLCGLSPNQAETNTTGAVLKCQANRSREATKKEKAHKFKVGDKVRFLLAKGAFDKGYEIKWSRDVYSVEKIANWKYLVDGKYRRENELQLASTDVELPKGKDPVKKARREKKVEQELKADDIKEENIAKRAKRDRPQKPIIDSHGNIFL